MHVYYIALLISLCLAAVFGRQQMIRSAELSDGIKVQRLDGFLRAFIVLLPLTLVLVFRWNVGVDSVYGSSYSTTYHLAARNINKMGFELGYYWLSLLFSKLRVPFFWYLFVLGLFYMACISYGIARLSVSPVISILVLLLLQSYFDSFSALRQAMAQGICVIALANWMRADTNQSRKSRTFSIYLRFCLHPCFTWFR